MNFLPSPGPLTLYAPPDEADGLRIDDGVREGDQVTFHYDPMIAKLVSHGDNRDAALDLMGRALDEFRIDGISTNIAFLRKLVDHPRFRAGDTFTGFVDSHLDDLI